MSPIHEPGEAWHIGWEWHADLWFVEPPFDVELDEPIKWFNVRHEAFEFVEKQIREQPVRVSVVDGIPEQPFDLQRQRIPDDDPQIPHYVPCKIRVDEEPGTVPGSSRVSDRVDEYASRVGLK